MCSCHCSSCNWAYKLSSLKHFSRHFCIFWWNSLECRRHQTCIHYSHFQSSLLDWAPKRFIKSHFQILDHISLVSGWVGRRKNVSWLTIMTLETGEKSAQKETDTLESNSKSFLEDIWIFNTPSSSASYPKNSVFHLVKWLMFNLFTPEFFI